MKNAPHCLELLFRNSYLLQYLFRSILSGGTDELFGKNRWRLVKSFTESRFTTKIRHLFLRNIVSVFLDKFNYDSTVTVGGPPSPAEFTDENQTSTSFQHKVDVLNQRYFFVFFF